MVKRRNFLIALLVACAALLPAFVKRFLKPRNYTPAVESSAVPKPSQFNQDSTAEEVTRGIDLSGKTALVTGCNSGIGFETMRVLAANGAHVIGCARTMEKATTACDAVDGETTPLVVELTDFPGISSAAEYVNAHFQSLDMLILNAGIMALPNLELVYGLEKQFVVNHLGHFLLTKYLFDLLAGTEASRAVVLSSRAHRWAPEEGIQFDNLDGKKGYAPRTAYGQSKLANALFSRELARRLSKSSATSNSLHPGVINTNLSRHLPADQQTDNSTDYKVKNVAEGAATTCYVAAHPNLENVTGYYFADCNMKVPNAQMQDDAMAYQLWEVSERLVSGVAS